MNSNVAPASSGYSKLKRKYIPNNNAMAVIGVSAVHTVSRLTIIRILVEWKNSYPTQTTAFATHYMQVSNLEKLQQLWYFLMTTLAMFKHIPRALEQMFWSNALDNTGKYLNTKFRYFVPYKK